MSSIRALEEMYWIQLSCASSLTQQSTDRHVAPLRHVILIPSKSVLDIYFLMLCAYRRNGNCQFENLSFDNTEVFTHTLYTLSNLSITQPMRLINCLKCRDTRTYNHISITYIMLDIRSQLSYTNMILTSNVSPNLILSIFLHPNGTS